MIARASTGETQQRESAVFVFVKAFYDIWREFLLYSIIATSPMRDTIFRAPALQAVRLVWVPRTSRSATPKRPFVGRKMTWHFRFRFRSALHRSLFGVPTKMQLTPRSLATNSSGSSKSYRTGRASPLLDDEIASRKSALTQCWLINSAVRVNAAPLPHVKRPLLLRAQLE